MSVHQLKYEDRNSPSKKKRPYLVDGIPSIGPSEFFKSAELVGTLARSTNTGVKMRPIPLRDALSRIETPSVFRASDARRKEPENPRDEDLESETPSDKSISSLSKKRTPVSLAEQLTDLFMAEWLGWEPETLRHEISTEVPGRISREAWEKIQAGKLCLLSEVPWQDWDVFEKVALAFNNVIPDFGHVQALSPAQVAYACHQMEGLRDNISFTGDAESYIAIILRESGLLVAPDGLEFADEIISNMFHRDHPELQDIKDEIRWKWVRMKSPGNRSMIDETIVGIQLARLSSIEKYIRMMTGK